MSVKSVTSEKRKEWIFFFKLNIFFVKLKIKVEYLEEVYLIKIEMFYFFHYYCLDVWLNVINFKFFLL